MNPLISVIVPSYMEEMHIRECLNSICTQTYQNIEILCIDDNSKDKTFEIITEYQKTDPRIHPFRNPGKGVASARNYGIEKASGEWIMFVDSDDLLQPQSIEFLLKSAQESSSEIALCSYERNDLFQAETFQYSYSMCSAEEIFSNMEMKFAAVWAKFFSKHIIGDTRFEEFKVGEDTVFCAEIWKKISDKKIAFVDLPLYHYTKNSSSTLSNPNEERRRDMVLSRLRTSEILSDNFPSLSLFYFEQALIYIAAYKRKKYKFSKEITHCFRKIFFRYYINYFFCRKISLANKIYIAISFLLPSFAAKIYRN